MLVKSEPAGQTSATSSDREGAADLFRDAFDSGNSSPQIDEGGAARSGISQVAREFGVSPRTLRFYEQKRLLAPERRGGTRLYKPDDIKRLKLILMGKRVGFSLAEIRQVMALYDSSTSPAELLSFVLGKFDEQAEFLESLQTEIKLAHSELKHARAVASDMLKKRRSGAGRTTMGRGGQHRSAVAADRPRSARGREKAG